MIGTRSRTSGLRSVSLAIVVCGWGLYGSTFAWTTAPSAGSQTTQHQPARRTGWPTPARETRPWTRWWWMGNAVDAAGITSELESFKAAGLGGVEITPIYGVAQVESRFVPYLSPEWVRLLEHTLREASRLGLGVDMATGTGWPFGGPWVGERDAARGLAHRTWTLGSGQRLREPVRFDQPALASCDRLLGPRGQRANLNAGGASKTADRRPRATARGECQSAGAGSRAGPLSQDASDPRAGRLLERRCRRRPHLEGLGRRHPRLDRTRRRLDAVWRLSRLARQDRGTRRARGRGLRHRSLLPRFDRSLPQSIRTSLCRTPAHWPSRLLQRLVRSR